MHRRSWLPFLLAPLLETREVALALLQESAMAAGVFLGLLVLHGVAPAHADWLEARWERVSDA